MRAPQGCAEAWWLRGLLRWAWSGSEGAVGG
jgi:hypothetical protein